MPTIRPSLFRGPVLCLLAWVAGCIPQPPVPDAPPAFAAPAQLEVPAQRADEPDPSICTAGYVRIEPGTFTMGSPTGEEGHNYDETQHSVTITRAYCMKATEVTQGEWQAVMGSNPSQQSRGSNYPVDQVSSSYAVAYANALSRRDNLPECYDGMTLIDLACKGYRLPTEAEWEFAARAGTTEAAYGELDSVAWFSKYDGHAKPIEAWLNEMHPVGQKQPNAWGLYDMLGNVWEWTEDWYAPFNPSAVTDPIGHGSNVRVIRGGSRNDGASRARAASRVFYPPESYRYDIGFRLVRTVP